MPGVADNMSYKNSYHFRDSYFNKNNSESLNVDPDINSTIKANPYKANVEIEGKEVILKPDMSALFRAVGKRHSRGGMDVQLDPDTFIFSDYKPLAFTKQDLKSLDLDEGNGKAKDNTPAKLIMKHVNPKHYNTLINNITDVNKDELAKKTSTRMLEKYLNTLGNIAFLQEQKKAFPTGVPSFSQGTAPVYSPELKDDIEQQKQYAKAGGRILPKAQEGRTLRISDQDVTEEGAPVLLRYFNGDPKRHADILKIQQWLNPVNPVGSPFSNELPPDRTQYPNYVLQSSRNPAYEGFPMNRPYRPTIDTPRITINRKEPSNPSGVKPRSPSGVPPEDKLPPRMPYNPKVEWPKVKRAIGMQISAKSSYPQVKEIEGDSTNYISADWEFTPYQKLSQLYNASKYAGVKRYMPMRSHLNPSYVDPSLVNPEQALGDMRSGFNAQLRGINTMSPILRNAQSAESYGQYIDKEPGVRSQYDNQNIGIKNQFAQYNNQIANGIRGTNMQNDQNYYKESVVGQQNFDNMKSFLSDKWADNVTRDVETNQTLAYNLLTQRNPAYRFNYKNNRMERNAKDLRDASSSNSRGNYQEQLTENLMRELNNMTLEQRFNFLGSMSKKQYEPARAKKGGMFRPRS